MAGEFCLYHVSVPLFVCCMTGQSAPGQEDPWMSYAKMYSDLGDCPWYFLDVSFKTLLGVCVILFGFLGVVLNCWLVVTYIQSHLMSLKSHLLVLNVFMGKLGRGILAGFPFSGPSSIAGRWIFGMKCCKLFAFLHQLLGIFQITSLSILCLERFILMKRKRRDKDLGMKFYMISIVFCWVYAALFALPPLFSYGSYECDITGTVCTLDWRYKTNRQMSFNLLVAIFGGIVPILVMAFSLWKTTSMKRDPAIDAKHLSLTNSTFLMVGFVIALWIPQGILSMWIAISSWSSSREYYNIPKILSIIAPLGAEAATMVPVLTYLYTDLTLRTALLGRLKKDYGIILRIKESWR